jgi:ABC-type multidrug transport system fused ATPase/permease subunit
MLPNVISGLIEANVSLQRVEKFLLMEELDPQAVQRVSTSASSVRITNGTFRWAGAASADAKGEESPSSTRPALENINVDIKKGELVAVVGSVGSGKSSFVAALLGNIHKESGTVLVNGTVRMCLNKLGCRTLL